jgi:hypothetical protein
MNFLIEIIPTVTREEEFILCHARAAMSGPARARIDRLTATPIKWGRIDELAAAHHLRRLLHRHLKHDKLRPTIPPNVWRTIESHAIAVTAKNSLRSHELIRIIKLLRNENIPALPFKGPILAAQIYGDPALREFSNLDLLVRTEDLLRTKLLLVHHGFIANENVAAENLDAQLSAQFTSADGNVQLHLHTHLLNDSSDSIWKRATWTDLAASPVRTIAREDLFPLLLAQGARHHWERLSSLVDIAEFLRANPVMNYAAILESAKTAGNWRVYALGFYLAYGLLDAPIPREILKEVSAPEVFELASNVGTWLFHEENRLQPGAMDETRFHLKSKERVTDRLAVGTQFFKRKLFKKEGA